MSTDPSALRLGKPVRRPTAPFAEPLAPPPKLMAAVPASSMNLQRQARVPPMFQPRLPLAAAGGAPAILASLCRTQCSKPMFPVLPHTHCFMRQYQNVCCSVLLPLPRSEFGSRAVRLHLQERRGVVSGAVRQVGWRTGVGHVVPVSIRRVDRAFVSGPSRMVGVFLCAHVKELCKRNEMSATQPSMFCM